MSYVIATNQQNRRSRHPTRGFRVGRETLFGKEVRT